jgi:hypothetical protein
VRTGLVWLAALNVAVAAVTVGSSSVAAAQPAGPASWRFVAMFRHCRLGDDLLSVAATGPRDAWALGLPGSVLGGGSPCTDVEHWNGSTWRRIPLPRGVGPDATFSQPVAASSVKNAWIFPALASARYCSYNYALGWDGRAWHRSDFPAKMTVQTAVAFSRKDVWAFGTPVGNVDLLIRYAARYDGRTWHRVQLPGPAFAVSALSKRDMWAIGPSQRTAAKPLTRQTIIAMRWTVRSWHTMVLPKIRAHAGHSHIDQAQVTIAGPDNVWWSYEESQGDRSWVRLLRWDGASWHHITVPASIEHIDATAQDGHGGLWLLGDIDNLNWPQQYWYHYSDGRWTWRPVHSPRGYHMIMLSGMTWIPRTTRVWAVGGAFKHRSFAVIARYGPPSRSQ